MVSPNYKIELMPTDALINHANALQEERKELRRDILTLRGALQHAYMCRYDKDGDPTIEAVLSNTTPNW